MIEKIFTFLTILVVILTAIFPVIYLYRYNQLRKYLRMNDPEKFKNIELSKSLLQYIKSDEATESSELRKLKKLAWNAARNQFMMMFIFFVLIVVAVVTLSLLNA